VRLLLAPVPPAVAGPPCDTIILLPDEGDAHDPDAVLRRRWRLTRAEMEIARHLWAGLEPREIADARGSSLATVRTQIKTLLGKAGAARQTEFIRQVSDLLTSDAAQSGGDAP
jgi:DNA-binding CsgD family transcriptional regulator